MDKGRHSTLMILTVSGGIYNYLENIDKILSVELWGRSKYNLCIWSSGSRRERWWEIIYLYVDTWMAEEFSRAKQIILPVTHYIKWYRGVNVFPLFSSTINYHNFIRNPFEFIIYNFTNGRFHLVLLPRYTCGIFFVFLTIRFIFTLKFYHLIVSMMVFEIYKRGKLTDFPADLIKNHLHQIFILVQFLEFYKWHHQALSIFKMWNFGVLQNPLKLMPSNLITCKLLPNVM